MGVSEAFQAVVNLVRHGYLHEQNIELDEIRSEFPFLGSSDTGMLSFAAGAPVINSFDLAVPSGHIFHLKTLIVDAPQEAQRFHLFDGPGVSVPLFVVQVGQSQTEIITGLQGILVNSVLCASTTSSLGILRAGGLIREKTGE